MACKYCDDNYPQNLNRFPEINSDLIILNKRNAESKSQFVVAIEPGNVDERRICSVDINYCPVCGRKLKGEIE